MTSSPRILTMIAKNVIGIFLLLLIRIESGIAVSIASTSGTASIIPIMSAV